MTQILTYRILMKFNARTAYQQVNPMKAGATALNKTRQTVLSTPVKKIWNGISVHLTAAMIM